MSHECDLSIMEQYADGERAYDIAEEMGVPVRAVAAAISRGIDRLIENAKEFA